MNQTRVPSAKSQTKISNPGDEQRSPALVICGHSTFKKHIQATQVQSTDPIRTALQMQGVLVCCQPAQFQCQILHGTLTSYIGVGGPY